MDHSHIRRILAGALAIMFLYFAGCASTRLKPAKEAFTAQRYAETITLCRQAIVADSTDLEAYLLLSKSYRRTDSLRQALATMDRAKKVGINTPKINTETAWVYRDMGLASQKDGNLQIAQRHWELAAEFAPKDTTIVRLLADVNMELGRMADARKHYTALLAAGADTTSIHPKLRTIDSRVETAESRLQRAVTAYNAGKLTTAKKLLDQVLQAQSDHLDALYYHYLTEGRLLYEAGKLVYKKGAMGKIWDAIVALGNAAAYRETAAEPHYYMGLAYEKKDKDEYTNAIAAYEKALALEPNGPKANTCKKKIRELKKKKEKMDKFWGRKH